MATELLTDIQLLEATGLIEDLDELGGHGTRPVPPQPEDDTHPVSRLLQFLTRIALDVQASEILIESLPKELRITYLIRGTATIVMTPPRASGDAIFQRLHWLSSTNLAASPLGSPAPRSPERPPRLRYEFDSTPDSRVARILISR